MRRRFSVILQLLFWFLPWKIRRALLKAFLGFKLGEGARIGFSIVVADEVIIGNYSAIRNCTVIKNLDKLVLGDYSYIVNLNWITGTHSGNVQHFTHLPGRKCELIIGDHSALTSRHFIDCTGGVKIGCFTTIGGAGSQILTHYIDPYEGRQTCKGIEIGDYCFVGTKVLLLPGSGLPDYSILGGGSVLVKYQDISKMLYAGNPAIPKKDLSRITVKYFERKKGVVD